MSAPLLEVRGLVKDYQSLRPLRVARLDLAGGEIASIGGLDAQAAEMLVHLVTGAALPDAGAIVLFGTDTAHVPNAEAWLRSLDGLGLVSRRAVLIDQLSVLQNVAMPLTLDIEPIDPAMRPRVDAIAREAGIDPGQWMQPLRAVDPETALRVRFARAIALAPTLVIAEHPSADLPRTSVSRVAADFAAVAKARGAALLALTADPEFARALGGRALALKPATGELVQAGGFFGRLLGRG